MGYPTPAYLAATQLAKEGDGIALAPLLFNAGRDVNDELVAAIRLPQRLP